MSFSTEFLDSTGVAVCIVHLLEAVEIDEQDCQRVAVPRGVLQGHLEPIEKERAVSDARQPIKVRLLVELLRGPLAITR